MTWGDLGAANAPHSLTTPSFAGGTVPQQQQTALPFESDRVDDEEYTPSEPGQRNEAAATNDAAAAQTHNTVSAAADTNMSAAAERVAEPQLAAAAEAKADRPRSRLPPPLDERHQAFGGLSRENVLNSYNSSRTMDGLAPVHFDDPIFSRHYDRMVQQHLNEDDEGLAAEDFNEKLTPDERAQFDEAKDQALNVWFENDAWRPVNIQEVNDGQLVLARFLQRWKPTKTGRKANARVIIQGFRHRDVVEQKLDRESPTLSMTG